MICGRVHIMKRLMFCRVCVKATLELMSTVVLILVELPGRHLCETLEWHRD
jgi:hypothetical protein